MTSNSKTTTAINTIAVVFRLLGGATVGNETAGVGCVGLAAAAAATAGGGAGAASTGAGAGGAGVGAVGCGGGGAVPVAAGGAALLGHFDGGMITVAPKSDCAGAGRSAACVEVGAPQS